MLHVFTPDAAYSDGGEVERNTAGTGVAFEARIITDRARSNISQQLLDEADALIIWGVNVDDAFIARIPKCRIIVQAGVGFNHIDLAATGAAGIPVCNTPDYGTSEVADHAIALMLALTRGLMGYNGAMHRDPVGNFTFQPAVPLVRRIRSRVFGVVGMGRIGSATALRAKAFGMRVVAYDPYVAAGQEIALGIERVQTLDELLVLSDVLSLHAPLTDETRSMIDAAALARMKDDAVLINTARGAIVDVEALLSALEQGRIAGAGLDVLPMEPPSPTDAIAQTLSTPGQDRFEGRLIVTPHAAWYSPEGRQDLRRLSMETTIGYLRHGRLRNLVNGKHLMRHREG